jgi:hypothetical protein
VNALGFDLCFEREEEDFGPQIDFLPMIQKAGFYEMSLADVYDADAVIPTS